MPTSTVFLPLYGVLVVVAIIDHKTYRIPNAYLLTILLYAGIFMGFGTQVYPFSGLFLSALLSIIPSVMQVCLKRSVFLGWGDVKLMGVCALFLPGESLGSFLIMTGVLGILYRGLFRKDPIPFAPAIGVAFFLLTMGLTGL